MVDRGAVTVIDLDRDGRRRAARLMEKYLDVPMALADASLVVLAEELRLDRVFTLDTDFHVYRPHGRGHFQVVPGAER